MLGNRDRAPWVRTVKGRHTDGALMYCMYRPAGDSHVAISVKIAPFLPRSQVAWMLRDARRELRLLAEKVRRA